MKKENLNQKNIFKIFFLMGFDVKTRIQSCSSGGLTIWIYRKNSKNRSRIENPIFGSEPTNDQITVVVVEYVNQYNEDDFLFKFWFIHYAFKLAHKHGNKEKLSINNFPLFSC